MKQSLIIRQRSPIHIILKLSDQAKNVLWTDSKCLHSQQEKFLTPQVTANAGGRQSTVMYLTVGIVVKQLGYFS